MTQPPNSDLNSIRAAVRRHESGSYPVRPPVRPGGRAALERLVRRLACWLLLWTALLMLVWSAYVVRAMWDASFSASQARSIGAAAAGTQSFAASLCGLVSLVALPVFQRAGPWLGAVVAVVTGAVPAVLRWEPLARFAWTPRLVAELLESVGRFWGTWVFWVSILYVLLAVIAAKSALACYRPLLRRRG